MRKIMAKKVLTNANKKKAVPTIKRSMHASETTMASLKKTLSPALLQSLRALYKAKVPENNKKHIRDNWGPCKRANASFIGVNKSVRMPLFRSFLANTCRDNDLGNVVDSKSLEWRNTSDDLTATEGLFAIGEWLCTGKELDFHMDALPLLRANVNCFAKDIYEKDNTTTSRLSANMYKFCERVRDTLVTKFPPLLFFRYDGTDQLAWPFCWPVAVKVAELAESKSDHTSFDRKRFFSDSVFKVAQESAKNSKNPQIARFGLVLLMHPDAMQLAGPQLLLGKIIANSFNAWKIPASKASESMRHAYFPIDSSVGYVLSKFVEIDEAAVSKFVERQEKHLGPEARKMAKSIRKFGAPMKVGSGAKMAVMKKVMKRK